jgi:glycosyltransferase involved in cell wall biosynthesis
MRIAILETIVMPAGHEIEFDRILVEELKKQGHDPRFFVPEKFPFKIDYHVPVDYLKGGEAISYAGASRVKKIWLSVQRERRRIAWFDDAAEKARAGLCDAIIVPTNSWRVMRSIKKSMIRTSSVPVLFMFHGIMPADRQHLISGVRSLRSFPNIHLGVIGLQTEFPELKDCPNFHTLYHPVYVPLDMQGEPKFAFHTPLRLGFFGQYRREKNLEFFLKAFTEAHFTTPVELTVQGATVTQADSDDFERLAKKYANIENIKFLHKNLLGIEWQKAIMDCDIILMPYGAERYRYQPSGMLFTGLGYFKPVLQSPEMNPEILQEFKVGEAVKLDSVEVFAKQLENFINTFKEKAPAYEEGLRGANTKYSQANLLKKIVSILSMTNGKNK